MLNNVIVKAETKTCCKYHSVQLLGVVSPGGKSLCASGNSYLDPRPLSKEVVSET